MTLSSSPDREKYLYIETFGCQMNVSDSDKIVALLQGVGYTRTTDSSRADLILLNTCSVRAKAEQKVYQHLGHYKGLKRGRPRLIIGVGGCVAQQEGERLLEKVPHLDLVFGTHNLHRLPELVRAAEAGRRVAEVEFMENEVRRDLFPIDDTPGGVTRFVTVMQGCDNFCSYCVVPFVRGREISRRSAEVVSEVRGLVGRGVREVMLLGQNVNSYGLKDPDELDFAALLRQLAAIDGLERIRFTTSHPKDISAPLISCFAELPKLCSHIHLPAQAGSDAVLAMMNRGYTRSQYLAAVAALKAVRPDIQVTGDMIVGFPGETEEDFLQTLSLMEEVRYADLFSFIYSPRPETPAAGLPDPVVRAEKQERLSRLQGLQRTHTLEGNTRCVGTKQAVLVEGTSKRGDQLCGRTSGNRMVNFAGDTALIGRLVGVHIVRAYQNSLLGELREP
ncbi:MAG TPA: tRNA (N6-isopentenyl adenosine(37)-C2)-methylthiotransferase MiaB [Geobacteraceae bacterium]